MISPGHTLLCSPLPPVPHLLPGRQAGRQSDVMSQEAAGSKLERDLVSDAEEMCPMASRIFIPERPPHPLEWLLIFNPEVCGFTSCRSRQSQRASRRRPLLHHGKDTRCLCAWGCCECLTTSSRGGVGGKAGLARSICWCHGVNTSMVADFRLRTRGVPERRVGQRCTEWLGAHTGFRTGPTSGGQLLSCLLQS